MNLILVKFSSSLFHIKYWEFNKTISKNKDFKALFLLVTVIFIIFYLLIFDILLDIYLFDDYLYIYTVAKKSEFANSFPL
jgi:hypothetical protein